MQTASVCPADRRAEDLEQVVLEAAALADAQAAGVPGVPQRILIVPLGEVRSTAGDFLVDEAALAETIAAFEAHGAELPIDYEHQTLGGAYSSPTGQAPAAGWIRRFIRASTSRPGGPRSGVGGGDGHAETPTPGLWADVAWTGEGRRRLANKEYRYISPVALVRRSDRRLVGIHSVALTNKPAIVGIKPLVNRDEAGAGEGCGAGLREGSRGVSPVTTDGSYGPEAHATRMGYERVPQDDVSLVALRTILSLDASSDDAVVLMAAVQRIRELERAAAQRDAADRVAAAMSAGKLAASQRDWALALAMRDPEEFDRWAESAPRIVPLGRMPAPDGASLRVAANRSAVGSSARAEWRANKSFLEKLCDEEAYASSALRECSAQSE